MNTYKAYDPAGNAIIFRTLAELRKSFDLTSADVSKCFYPGVHTLKNGVRVITF